MSQFLQQVINGLSLGSIYALIALGYTMVYGIIKLINFAHGDIYMLGAYVAFITTTYFGFSFFPAMIASMVVCGILGVLTCDSYCGFDYRHRCQLCAGIYDTICYGK